MDDLEAIVGEIPGWRKDGASTVHRFWHRRGRIEFREDEIWVLLYDRADDAFADKCFGRNDGIVRFLPWNRIEDILSFMRAMSTGVRE